MLECGWYFTGENGVRASKMVLEGTVLVHGTITEAEQGQIIWFNWFQSNQINQSTDLGHFQRLAPGPRKKNETHATRHFVMLESSSGSVRFGFRYAARPHANLGGR